MKTDVNGCSTCLPGEENFETFYSNILHKDLVQYDYRHPNGKLYSVVAKDLETCRMKVERMVIADEQKAKGEANATDR
jgi:hypothetical protein